MDPDIASTIMMGLSQWNYREPSIAVVLYYLEDEIGLSSSVEGFHHVRWQEL
jgi:hypothetical protein